MLQAIDAVIDPNEDWLTGRHPVKAHTERTRAQLPAAPSAARILPADAMSYEQRSLHIVLMRCG
ncbi:hypothetical protein [Tunturiibacter psychrotolerans]|uniref:hypothetical protein n=1 Tax=Tunturiibacter psychrotolerans TaxID=3069686 RepID=UPI003D1F11BA